MRRLVLLIAFLMAFTVASDIEAKTRQEVLQSAVDRVSVRYLEFANTGNYKGLCVCDTLDRVGVLESFPAGGNGIGITCNVYAFRDDGSVSSSSACYEWTPLTK